MSCKPFKTSEANAKSYLRTQGVIDKFLNIKDLGKFREFHSILRGQAKDKYFFNVPGWNEKLFLEEQGGKKIVPNKVVFKQIDNINGVKYSKFTTTEIDPQNVESILTMLSDKFSIPFETINDPKQDYSGKFEDGRVYVNLAHVTPETAWHEFAHPFIEQVKEDNPKLYRSLVNEIQSSTYGKQVLAEVKELYPELNEEGQIEEAIVETIARFVTGKVSETELKENKTFFQKVLDFVQKIKDTLAAALNVGNVNIADLDNDFTLKHMAEIMQHGGRINLKEHQTISKIKDGKESIVQFKNQYTVKDLNGVFHNVGGYMNTGGVVTIEDAINKLIEVMSKGDRLELAAFSGRSKIPLTLGSIQLSFKNESPILESYLRDVASDLVNRGGKLKRVGGDFKQYAARETDSEYSTGINDEVFINATEDNIKELKVIRSITSSELEKLKELSNLTGAPIVGNGNVIYQPTTVKPYKGQAVKYSKFGVDKKVKAELNKVTDTLVTYLSNYGITVKDISEIKDTLKIDEVGFADILSKIAYIKNEENLPAVAGEFIAYMMQHNGLIQSMVKNFAAANNELKYTRNAIYYVASGLGKSVLAEKNPNKFADMDELVKNAVIKATGSSYDTSTNSKLIFENDLVQKYLKEEIEKVMETKVILSPIDPEKIKLLGFKYKKHYVPTKENVSKIVAGIKSRTTNPYEISDEKYVERYVTPYTSDEKVEAVEVGGYIVDEFDDVNDLSELLNQYLDRSEYNQVDNYKDLNKTEYFKIIGKLVAERLHKKINEKLSTKLLNAIKDIIKQFFGLLNRGPKKYDAQRMISTSVEAIVNAIISNDKNFITKSIYKPGAEGKPISQVSVEQALETDPFGKSIIYKLSEYGFILTGSTALSEQGTILRPDENPLHDIDWVSPFTEQDTHEKFLDAYPEAIWFRDIDSEDQVTKSYVIAPDGHHIQNHVITTTPAGKVFIDSYEVVNDEGEIVGTYKLVTTNGKPKEVEWGVKGKVIDFFTYKNVSEAVEKEPMKFKTKDGVTMLLSNWKSIFKAKLAWARYKDIWDYNRFVPNVQKNDEESVSLQINELIREGIITAKCN